MPTVLILIAISGIIAYLGDVLGTQVGKKRLSLFGLRPRVTAVIVSISTGIFITLFTLFVAILLSENVKIALFSMQSLTEEREKLGKEVKALLVDKAQLHEELNLLKNSVRIKEQESLVLRKDATIVAMVIEGNRPPTEILASLSSFIGEVSRKARARGLKSKAKEELVSENIAQLAKMSDYVAGSPEPLVIAAVAGKHLHIGEDLGQVVFRCRPNSLIFKTGERIATFQIDGSKNRSEISKTLQEFMEEINYEVVKQGMLEDPFTGRFGDLSSDSALSFFDMVNKIKLLGRTITLEAIVQEDTYVSGPLNVAFRLEEN